MSVRQRTKIFESRAEGGRWEDADKGEEGVVSKRSFRLDDLDAKENRPELPERPPPLKPPRPAPDNATLQQLAAQSVGKTKAVPVPKWRPPVPPKSKSTNDIGRSSAHDAPPRITLLDLEDEDASSAAEIQRYGEENEFIPPDSTPEFNKLTRDSSSLSLEQARKKTALLSENVLNDARKLTETGLARSKTTVESFFRATSPLRGKIGEGVERVRSNATDAFDKSGASKTFSRVAEGAQTGLNEVKSGTLDVLDKTGITKAFAHTADDFKDIAAKLARKQGLCSKCQSLPVENNSPPDADDAEKTELDWATPLSRVIYHSDWCRMCQLFLSMLCRTEFDPLLHPEVSQHIPPELKGYSMQQWVSKGWEYTDAHWPFGRGEHRHEGATYVLGPAGQILSRITGRAAKVTGRIMIRSSIASSHGKKYVRRPRRNLTYADGVREARQQKTRYPLSCVLRVSLSEPSNNEFPCLLFVNLLGFGNHPSAAAQSLSHFRLKVAHGASSIKPTADGLLSYGRLLNKEWIEISVAKSWIENCESRHGKKCSEHGWAVAMQKPEFLRVIDTRDYCVVETPDPAGCRFIALSYVWGGAKTVKLRNANIDNLMQKGGLRKYMKIFPRTITDAMEVVKAIGERYLWVDSLCILQENTKEAFDQIATMDRVYGSALLTIVAAEGVDAYAGLRGIRLGDDFGSDRNRDLPRQISQSVAEIKPGLHIIAPFVSRQDIASSGWNTRAWTYQEKLLSRRLLVFAGDEVIWHCRSMVCREDMPVEGSGYPHPPLDWLALKPQYLGVDVDQYWIDGSLEVTRHGATHVVRSGTFSEYARMIEQYTTRTLSFSSDILNALAGLQHIFQLCFKSEFRYGLPEILLDIAILWRPTEQLKRRKSSTDGQLFPSWAWAGWVGQVAYDKPLSVKRGLSGEITGMTQEQSGEEGVRPLLQWYMPSKNNTSLIPVNGTGRGIPLKNRDPPREWEASGYVETTEIFKKADQTPRLSEIESSTRPHIGNRHLLFWTSCANCFQLGNAQVQESDRKWNRPTPPTRFSIVDTSFEAVGTILLDSDGPDWINREKHEFILLAEGQYFGLDDEPLGVGEFPNYIVMLIERDDETKIATRLGIGRIRKTAWMLAKAVLQLVCLG